MVGASVSSGASLPLVEKVDSFVDEMENESKLTEENIAKRREKLFERRKLVEEQYRRAIAAIDQDEKDLEEEIESEKEYLDAIKKLAEIKAKRAKAKAKRSIPVSSEELPAAQKSTEVKQAARDIRAELRSSSSAEELLATQHVKLESVAQTDSVSLSNKVEELPVTRLSESESESLVKVKVGEGQATGSDPGEGQFTGSKPKPSLGSNGNKEQMEWQVTEIDKILEDDLD